MHGWPSWAIGIVFVVMLILWVTWIYYVEVWPFKTTRVPFEGEKHDKSQKT